MIKEQTITRLKYLDNFETHEGHSAEVLLETRGDDHDELRVKISTEDGDQVILSLCGPDAHQLGEILMRAANILMENEENCK